MNQVAPVSCFRSLCRIAVFLALMCSRIGSASAQPGSLLFTSAARLGQQSLSNSSYVIDNIGRLWVAGANDSGQLGIGSRVSQRSFVEVPIPSGAARWTRVAAGRCHVIALADSDKIYGWGANGSVQLGSRFGSALSPVHIPNPAGVTAWRDVSAGEDHSVALDKEGRLYAWGDNTRGELAATGGGQSNEPLLIPAPAPSSYWTATAAGAGFTLGVTERGLLYIWGVDSLHVWSQAGGSSTPVLLAKGIRGYGPLPTVAAGSGLWSVVGKRGERDSWGRHPSGFQYNAFSVAAGGGHLLDLDIAGSKTTSATGVIVTEGNNDFGELGIGSTSPNGKILNPPAGARNWLAVAAGLHHSLAIADDGYLYGWGDNSHGQLGLGATTNCLVPTRLMRVGDSVALALAIDAPTWLPANPFGVQLTIRDTSNQLPGVNAPILAHFVGTPTLWLNSAFDREFAIASLHIGDSAKLQWSVYGDSTNNYATSATAYAYVTAPGAAPSFVLTTVNLDVKKGLRPVTGRVIDSLTRAPISNAIVRRAASLDSSSIDGKFNTVAFGSVDTYVVSHENYRSRPKSYLIPYLPDTLDVTVALDSSDVVGSFVEGHGYGAGMPPIDHLYFPDSVVGYAIASDSAGCTVYRSNDRGLTWGTVGRLLQPMDALVFADAAEGWVVGKAGLIAHTSDSGASWRYESPTEGGPDLHGLAYANGYVWAVGDRGTILIKEPNRKWRHDSTIAVEDLRAIHLFNRYKGISVGGRGYVYYRDLDHWIREPVSAVSTFTACFMPAFERAYLADSAGDVYSINPADVYATLAKLPVRMSPHLDPPGRVSGLFFINPAVGWAVGAKGAAIVTYDSGHTWAPVSELNEAQNTIDFWSTTGYAASTDTLSVLRARSVGRSSIVRGRVTDPSGVRGLSGAEITLHCPDSTTRVTYSNQKGNYVITGVPPGTTTQTIDLYFWDTTGVWRAEQSLTAASGTTLTIDFQHPSVREVTATGFAELASHVVQSGEGIEISTEGLLEGGTATVYDLLGQTIASFSIPAGTAADMHSISNAQLTSGAYFVTVRSATRSLFYKFLFQK